MPDVPINNPGGPQYVMPPGVPPMWAPPPADGGWFAEETEPEINVMDYVHLLWGQKWIIAAVVLVAILVGGAWAFTRTKLYRASTRIALEQAPQIIKNQIYSGVSWWELQHYAQDQVQVLETRRLAERVARKLGLDNPNSNSAAYQLLGNLTVKPVKDTNVLELSLINTDPKKAAEWLNLYVQEYIAMNIEDNLDRTRKVYEVIQSKLAPLRKQLEASEQKLLQFKERKDALFVGDQDKNVITEQVNTLTSAYAQAKTSRIRLETKIAALKRLRAENLSGASLPEIMNDPTIQQLRQQQNQLEIELAEKLQTYKSGHPIIKDLRSRIRGLNNKISEQIRRIVRSLQTDYQIKKARELALYSNLQNLRQQAIELSKQTLEYDKIQHEYEQNKRFYEEMLQRSKETDISSTAGLNNVRVIDPAVAPTAPYRPNPRRTLLLSVVLGLFLGVGLVLGLDYIDQTIRTPEDVERYLGSEPLVAVPAYTGETSSVAREVYHSLRTALMVAARNEGSQVILVTSATPQEGKTTTAFNLAKTLAVSGSKVLILDADLRKPSLHHLINTKNVRGLTSVVLGEREILDVAHTIADVPNLDIVTTGPLPPNPPELFSKKSFVRMLERAREKYDWIIMDSPPVASVTDSVIAAQASDLVLVVVRYGFSKRKVINDAMRQLTRTGARIAGVVLNYVDLERDHYYYAGYYSYYRYGYGTDATEGGDARKKKKKPRVTT
ncbi:MAG: polysaccharide biosynthesis tyrosine autokinase [Acidobacteria bacterium]|nr:polysaccharide biosynthesis tyrosine autokinase [Acidobacteriota bacterium]